MEKFRYVGGQLFAEEVSIGTIAETVGTPFYCYSSAVIESQYLMFSEAVKNLRAEICYSIKANSNIAVVGTLAKLGAGADVVSVGELQRAMAAGVAPNKIIFSGVGKTREEIGTAITTGIKQINVESEAELRLLSEISTSLGLGVNVAIRINPDIDAGTHEKITTGRSENKFGIDFTHARGLFSRLSEFPGINLNGIAVHIGSQLTNLEPYRRSYKKVAEFIKLLCADGIEIDNVDLGGGLGVRYNSETIPSPNAYSLMVEEVMAGLDCGITFEPGRIIVGDAGILVSRVIYVKHGEKSIFYIVDAAMNDLLRPTLYEAYHGILPIDKPDKSAGRCIVDVVGPICESGDYFAKGRELPLLVAGDLIAITTVGAYGAVMSSCYNSRPLVPEVMVNKKEFAIVRKRIPINKMIENENLPNWKV